ncbi:right-handed parallel beta-helix repeat-containing protein [Yoonia tamlensis]|uniref:right-handed parallel beta-helix repeat-containing protein n=1 Tax=Yoonia tamlensis TaxID=390270 RepID=UPI000B7DBD94|nr:right-handed parallel beta-helix repeat-containing protein [Yoonia tamlensis]
MLIICALCIFGGVAHAQPVPAGTDLTGITQAAQSGATIQLGPGPYPGIIVAYAKDLTILGAPDGSTVLTGSAEAEMVVTVDETGQVTLENLTITPQPQVGMGVYVQGGQAQMRHVTITDSTGPAVYLAGGRLGVDSAVLTRGAAQGILAFDASSIEITNCRIAGFAAQALAIQGPARAQLQQVDVAEIGAGALFAAQGAQLQLAQVTIDGAAGHGILVQENAQLAASDVQMRNVTGTGVLALQAGSLRMQRADIAAVNDTALIIQDTGPVAVTDSALLGLSGAVDLRNIVGRLHIENNVLRAFGDSNGLAIEGPVTGQVRANRIVGGRSGVVLSGQSQGVELHDNAVAARAGQALYGGMTGPVDISANAFLAANGLALLFENGTETAFANNLFAAQGETAVYVQHAAVLQSTRSMGLATADALVILQSAAAGHHAQADIWAGAAPAHSGGAIYAEMDIATDGTTRALGQVPLDRGAVDAVLAALTPAVDAAISGDWSGVIAARAALAELDADARAQVDAMGALQVTVKDRFGQDIAVGYTVYDLDNRIVGAGISTLQSGGAELRLPLGTYVVAADQGAHDPQVVDITRSGAKSVEIMLPTTALLKLEQWSNAAGQYVLTDIPVTLLPLAERQARWAPPASRQLPAAVLAPSGATQAALAQARAAYAGLDARVVALGAQYATPDQFPGGFAALNATYQRVRRSADAAERLIIAYGDQSDVAAAIAAARLAAQDGRGPYSALHRAIAIEIRLGRLQDGAVMALRDDPDLRQHAAQLLRQYGMPAADDVILQGLADPQTWGLAMAGLSYVPAGDLPQSHGYLREIIAAHHESAAQLRAQGADAQALRNDPTVWAARSAAIALIGRSDDPETLAAAFSVPQAEHMLREILPLIAGREALVANLIGAARPDGPLFQTNQIRMFCPVLDRLPEPEARAFEAALATQYQTNAALLEITNLGAQRSALFGSYLFNGHIAECRPNAFAAKSLFAPFENYITYAAWMRRDWAQPQALTDFASGDDSRFGVARHAGVDALAQALEGVIASETTVVAPALVVAAETYAPDYCAADWCHFSLRRPSDAPQGALIGRLHAQAGLIEGDLRIALTFDWARHREASLATMIENSPLRLAHLMRDGARPLVADVYLTHAGQRIALIDSPPPGSRPFVLQAALPDNVVGIDGLVLHVLLDAFGTQQQLVMPIGYGQDAARLRMAQARLSQARAAYDAAPDNPRTRLALGRALAATGQIDAAATQILAIGDMIGDPARVTRVAVNMYLDHDRIAAADALLAVAVGQYPQDAGLWRQRADVAYVLSDYATAAAAFGQIAAQDANARWWAAVTRALAGSADGVLVDLQAGDPGAHAAVSYMLERRLSRAAGAAVPPPPDATLLYFAPEFDLGVPSGLEDADDPNAPSPCHVSLFAALEAQTDAQPVLQDCAFGTLAYRLGQALGVGVLP